MSDQQPREIRQCLACGKELIDWRKKYCSDECQFGPELVPDEPASIEPAAEPQPVPAPKPKPPKPKPPKRRPPNPRPPDNLPVPIAEQADRAMARKAQSEQRTKVCKTCGMYKPLDEFSPDSRSTDKHCGICKVCLAKRRRDLQEHPEWKKPEGNPTKATPDRIQAVLADCALGLNEKEATAVNGVNYDAWLRWKNKSKRFPGLAAHAAGIRKRVLLQRMEDMANQKKDWKEAAFLLERRFPEFADPKVAIQLNQHIHGAGDNGAAISQEQLEEARKRLDEVKALQVARREAKERGETTIRRPDGSIIEEPIIQAPVPGVVGQTFNRTPKDEREPRAIEDQSTAKPVPEPERPVPAQPPQVNQSPAEPPTPWRDRKPLAGPLSTRQRWLVEERVRKGGEGKRPW